LSACKSNSSKINAKNNATKVEVDQVESHNTLTTDDLKIYDAETKKSINLSMTKNEVDKILGLQDKKDFKNMYNYNGLEVFYRDNKVAGLVIKASSNTTNRFKTVKSIGLGSKSGEITKLYGDSVEKNNNKYLTYIFEKKDNGLRKIEKAIKNTDVQETENLYCMSYLLFENNTVSMIVIGDYQYAINMK
jgi:hypothetical protein